MNFDIYVNDKNEKWVKYKNELTGKPIIINGMEAIARVFINNENMEYFHAQNPYNNYNNSFVGHIKDAVDLIKNGNGDCIIQDLKSVYVYKYLDIKYGEKLRKRSLKEWKNKKFIYTIKYGYTGSSNVFIDNENKFIPEKNNSSINGQYYLGHFNNIKKYTFIKNDKYFNEKDYNKKFIVFENKEDTIFYIDNIKNNAKEFINGYKKAKEKGSGKAYLVKNFKNNIIVDLAFAIIESEVKYKKPNCHNVGLSIWQIEK